MSRLLPLALLAVACRTVPVTPTSALEALAAHPLSHLVGTPVELASPVVLNAEDFVYDARLSADAKSMAVARLGMKGYFLSLFTLGTTPPTRRADTLINGYELDVEMVEPSPDGSVFATVGRDGAVRVFDATTGLARAAWLTDEPLVSLAIHPSGQWLVTGSAHGLITVLSFPGLNQVAEARGHSDEVRGLAFAPDGRLFSAGWDKHVTRWSFIESGQPVLSTRLHAEKKSGQPVFRAVLNGKVSVSTTIDARLPMPVVQAALAQAAGIEVSALTESATLTTAFGQQLAKVAKGQRFSFKGLTFDSVDVAICDACVPVGAQAVLGASLLERFDFASDESTHEVMITAKPGSAATSAVAPELKAEAVFTLEAYVNDLTIDAAGKTLGVALSGDKALRNREVYEREKRKEPAPFSEWDCGALLDAETGSLLSKHPVTGVVATAGISPDGQSLLTGGWNKEVSLWTRGSPTALSTERFGWAVRRVRFSRDARWASVAAWTPQNPLGSHQSDPSAVFYEVVYGPNAVVAP